MLKGIKTKITADTVLKVSVIPDKPIKTTVPSKKRIVPKIIATYLIIFTHKFPLYKPIIIRIPYLE